MNRIWQQKLGQYLTAIIMFIGIVCLLSILHKAEAQPTNPDETAETSNGRACSPVDVVFLVDQSSSMSFGPTAGGNDPLEQRKYAVEAAIDQLVDIALDLCPSVIHRVAVISFGSDAVIDLQLSEIGPFDPENPNIAFSRRETLKRSVQATELGQTNPAAAFALARQIFDEHGPAVSNETERRRAIIFITDGIPCVNDERGTCGPNYPFGAYAGNMSQQINQDFPFDQTLLEREQCINELRAQRIDPSAPLPDLAVNTCLIDHPINLDSYENSTYIWLLLMRDADQPYPQSLIPILENIAETHAGELILLSNNRQEIPTAFRDILEQLTGVRAARLTCGNFAVNPYLEKTRLVFYKADPSVKVKLTYRDVNGTEYILEDGTAASGGFELDTDGGYQAYGANERYIIKNPYPGIWNLSSDDCNNLDAFYEPINIAPSSPGIPQIIPQYDRLPYYNEANPYFLEFQLRNATTGMIVPQAEHPHFAVRVSAVIRGQGEDQNFTFEWVAQEQLFRATEPISARYIGKYDVVLTAYSFRREGEPTNVGTSYEQVFSDQFALYETIQVLEVLPVTPFVPDIISPAPDEILTPIHLSPGIDGSPDVTPVTIRVRITDRQGQTIFGSLVPIIFVDPDNSFTAEVTDPIGETQQIILQHDPANPGEFFGQITGLHRAGDYALSVELTGGFKEREYYPDLFEVRTEFSREDELWHFEVIDPITGMNVTPIHISLLDSGFRWPPWRLDVQPLTIHVRLVDEMGLPYSDPASIMEYAPRVIAATVATEDITRTTQLIPIIDSPGEYVGQIDDMATHGEHQLLVELNLNYPNYTPASVPMRIVFNRTDTFLSSPGTYVGLTVASALLLMFLIWRFFAVRNNKVAGELIFMDQGKELGRINLYSGKNWRVIKKRELDEYPQFGLKSITAYSVPKTKAVPDEDGAGAVGFMDHGREVKIDYVTDEGERVRGEILNVNSSISFGGVFQIKYENSTDR